MIAIVVAHSDNRVIGRDGGLPWHLPSDLRRFKSLTTGGTVLMGRRTFESLPPAVRPLPGRRNLVLSRDPGYLAPGAEVHQSFEGALAACDGDVFVIGGSRVFADALPLADRVLLTRVQGEHDGDAFFPALDGARWRRVEASDPITENGHAFRFEVHERAA